jgi:hypothetical protein
MIIKAVTIMPPAVCYSAFEMGERAFKVPASPNGKDLSQTDKDL